MNQAEAQFIGTLLSFIPQVLRGLTGGVESQDDDVDLANIEALLIQSLQDTAEIEGGGLKKIGMGALKLAKAIRVLGNGAEGALKFVPKVIDVLGGGAEMQDLAKIDVLLSQSLQDSAEMEGDQLKRIGKGALKVAKAIRVLGGGVEGALKYVPKVIDALGGGAEVQFDDVHTDLANIEGFLGGLLDELSK